MRTQTYYHTRFETDANRKNDTVPLQVNCAGVVSDDSFYTVSVRHDFYYVYVIKGKMVLEDFCLLPGEVLVIEPGKSYQYSAEGKTDYYWVHYTGYEAFALTKKAVVKPGIKQYIGVQQEIIDCFQKLFREFMIHDEASGQLSVCIMREIMIRTGRCVGVGEENTIPLLEIEYIHGFFKEDIDVESLAKMEHISCTAFRKIFKEHTGVSPNEYVIKQRISEACRLLSQTEKKINDIAVDVGYRDPYYFSRIFRKKVGVSPMKYRMEKLREDKE